MCVIFIYSKVCECMNSAPRHSLKRSQSDCHILCTENPSEYCGGRNAYSIYKTLFSGIRKCTFYYN